MKLLAPLVMGDLEIPNRIIMAPLTRCRAIANRVPNPLMAEYYRQRANAGFILSEATAVDPMGVGYPNTPGIWNDEQTEGWKLVTEAVHSAGGKILMRCWPGWVFPRLISAWGSILISCPVVCVSGL